MVAPRTPWPRTDRPGGIRFQQLRQSCPEFMLHGHWLMEKDGPDGPRVSARRCPVQAETQKRWGGGGTGHRVGAGGIVFSVITALGHLLSDPFPVARPLFLRLCSMTP